MKRTFNTITNYLQSCQFKGKTPNSVETEKILLYQILQDLSAASKHEVDYSLLEDYLNDKFGTLDFGLSVLYGEEHALKGFAKEFISNKILSNLFDL